jgi:hypothetical protein
MLAHAFLAVATAAERDAQPTPTGLITLTVNEFRRPFDALLLLVAFGERVDGRRTVSGVCHVVLLSSPGTVPGVFSHPFADNAHSAHRPRAIDSGRISSSPQTSHSGGSFSARNPSRTVNPSASLVGGLEHLTG